jgi:hypothetical protein
MVALAAVMVLFHGPLLWGGQVLSGGDTVNYFLPLRDLQAREGWFVGWNDYTFSGRPVMDDIQTGAFYPPNWLFMLPVPTEVVLTLLQMAQVYAGGVGMLVFLGLFLRLPAALLGAICWMAGGYVLSRLMYGITVFVDALCWVPWMLWAAERMELRRGAAGLRHVLLLGLFGGLQLNAGAAQMAQITWAGLLFWVIGRAIAPGEKETRQGILLGFAAAAVMALVLALPTLLGAARFQAQAMARAGGDLVAFLSRDSLTARHLWMWIAPHYFGPGNYEGVHWSGQTGYGEVGFFIGTGILAVGVGWLLGVPVRWRRLAGAERRRSSVMAVAAILGLAVAVGTATPLFQILVGVVPTFSYFRVPARWALWVIIPLIYFAAQFVDELMKPGAGAADDGVPADSTDAAEGASNVGLVREALLFSLAPLLLIAVVMGWQFLRVESVVAGSIQSADPQFLVNAMGYARAAVLTALGAVLLTAGCVAAMGLRPALRGLAYGALLLVTVADLRLHWQPFTIPVGTPFPGMTDATDSPYHRAPRESFREHYYANSQLVERLRGEVGRVHYTDTLPSWLYDQDNPEFLNERPIVHGIRITRGYQQLRLEGYVQDYYTSAVSNDGTMNSPFMSHYFLRNRLFLDVYNVTAVLSHDDEGLGRNLTGVGLVDEGPVNEYGLRLYRNPHARGWAWLSHSSEFGSDPVGAVTVSLRTASRWQMAATTREPSWLHVSAPAYGGWRMRAFGPDGLVVEGVAGGQSILLPAAGDWQIEREFDRMGLRVAWQVLALCLMVGLIGYVRLGRKAG